MVENIFYPISPKRREVIIMDKRVGNVSIRSTGTGVSEAVAKVLLEKYQHLVYVKVVSKKGKGKGKEKPTPSKSEGPVKGDE